MLLLLIPAMLYCNGKPQIQFDALIFDFGKQAPETELTHIFTFINSGKGVLKINKVEAG